MTDETSIKTNTDPHNINLPFDYPRRPVKSYWRNKKIILFSELIYGEINKIAEKMQFPLIIFPLTLINILIMRYNYPLTIQTLGVYAANQFNLLAVSLRNQDTVEEALLLIQKAVQQCCATDQPQSLFHPSLICVIKDDENAKDYFNSSNNKFLSEIPINLEHLIAETDLTFTITIKKINFEIEINYDQELFKPTTIDKLILQIQKLATGMTSNATVEMGKLPFISEDEKNNIGKLNQTQCSFPHKNSLIDGFYYQVDRIPETLAIISATSNLTYRQLMSFSNKISDTLQQLCPRKNNLIGILMEKGWEQVAAVLGILQSGNAYLPINIKDPAKRIGNLIKDSHIKIILIQNKYKNHEMIEDLKREHDLDLLAVDKQSKQQSISINKPDDLAYVMFTSGSTGQPKGVMLNHGNVINTIENINHLYQVNEKDRILCLANLNFDLSVYDIFGILSVGGQLILPDEQSLRDPAKWVQLIIANRPTIWNTTPQLLQLLINYIKQYENVLPIEILTSSIRLTLLSGDWIPLDLPEEFRTYFKNSKIISLGGATEASIWSIYYEINDIDKFAVSIPYGRPLANQKIYVLNEYYEDCPIGAPGEIFIGGKGLALGYYKDPIKTANHFIHHPKSHERLYKTGDIGKYHQNGYVELLGRIDNQTKIRGFRIELGEIEGQLMQHPLITKCMITHDGNSLIAYYISKNQQDIPIRNLYEFLKIYLPDYMLPAVFIRISEFPITENGKLDYASLPKSTTTNKAPEEKPLKHADEKRLAELWHTVLKKNKENMTQINITQINITKSSNFFELGGDSLLANQLQLTIDKHFNVNVAIEKIFANPTLKEMLKLIKRLRWIKNNSKILPHNNCTPGTEEMENDTN